MWWWWFWGGGRWFSIDCGGGGSLKWGMVLGGCCVCVVYGMWG